jgi:hypothetical protein
MAYLHIDNLYRNIQILEMKRCYAMEKIHGTSAHIKWNENKVTFFSGGEKHARFVELFNEEELTRLFHGMGLVGRKVVIYGEAYGGKLQGMKDTYGSDLKFVAFDVKIDDVWLDVLKAEAIVKDFDLEFVHYVETSTDIDELNILRDADSVQAIRNGMGEGKKQEGIVLRSIFEVRLNNGTRMIVKHKRDDFREMKTPREVDGKKLKVLTESREVADEWVTPMRMKHVLDKLPHVEGIEHTGDVIRAVLEDVLREGAGEFEDTKFVRKAISAEAARQWKQQVSKL